MTFDDVARETLTLSSLISTKPDIVIGITRGGLIPARLLSTYLNVKNMHCLTVRKTSTGRTVVTDITEDLKGKKVLLVEDVLESGKSLDVAAGYLKKKGASVETACLYTMPMTEVTPTYSLRRIETLVQFPWESIQ